MRIVIIYARSFIHLFNTAVINDPDRKSCTPFCTPIKCIKCCFVRSIVEGPISCNVSVDLGFVLDASNSLTKHFETSKMFIQTIAGAFDIHKDETHAGVVTFSDGAELSIKFDETLDYHTFYNAVDDIKQTRGNTRIDLGLMKAKDELFHEKNGARPGKKKVCVSSDQKLILFF